MYSIFSFAACLAAVSAYTQPVGNSPKGNPISLPGLNTIVPVGAPYEITWDPTTAGTVTLLLLKGPATNLALQNVIVEATNNNGKYSWTPSSDLQPSDPSAPAKGYGIQLIVDTGAEKGQYQYTTQFGISNPSYNGGSSSGSSGASSSSTGASSTSDRSTAPAYVPSSMDNSSTVPAASYTSPNATTSQAANATTMTSVTVQPTATATNGSAPSPYYPTTSVAGVAGAAAPTGAMGYPPTGNGTGITPSTGGAANLATSALSLVCAAGVAVFAF